MHSDRLRAPFVGAEFQERAHDIRVLLSSRAEFVLEAADKGLLDHRLVDLTLIESLVLRLHHHSVQQVCEGPARHELVDGLFQDVSVAGCLLGPV